MNRLKQLKTYPFGFFLILEWLFLGAAFFSELPIRFFAGQLDSKSVFFPIFSLICLIALGLTGLRFPKSNPVHKWLYTFWQLGLLGLPSLSQYFFFIPYLIIVIRSCLIFEKKERLLAVILIVFVFGGLITFCHPSFLEFQQEQKMLQEQILHQQFAVLKSINIIGNLFSFGLCSIFVFMLVNALLREYQSRQKLALAHQKLREYAMLIEDRATLDERNRIAREIHDSLGHTLTAQTIQLNNAIAFWQSEPTKAYHFLSEAKELVATALKDIRYSITTLRADPLAGKNLETAINLLFKEFSQRTGIIARYITTSSTYPFSEEVKITVYRIVQEALTNIAKHSEATKVTVKLETFPEYLKVSIADNGKGFNPEQNTTGFGLQGMRERVTALKGDFELFSDRHRGCIIQVNLPRDTSSINSGL